MRVGAAAVAVALLAALLLWGSGRAPGWLAPALSAVVTAVLVEAVRRQRRLHRGGPVECHVALSEVSFIDVPAGPGEPKRVLPASGHTVQLHVMAPERTAVLSGLRAVVLERRPPGGELRPAAGVLPPRTHTVLLDEDPPRLLPRGGETPAPFPYTVGPDAPETFELAVETDRWQVTWVLELDWICGERSGTSRIGLAGEPFCTAARPPRGLSWEGGARGSRDRGARA